MHKGLLFVIPLILAAIVAFATANVTMYAPVWSAGTAIIGFIGVGIYIRLSQKHNDNEPGKV